MATLQAPIPEEIAQRKDKELVKQADARQKFIDRIKQEIAQPFDNVNHPVPLFKQLQTGK